MKTFAFKQWCDRFELPTATRDFLARLRSSSPARRVQGRLLNVCGTYASRKMGISIQFESHTVELWAIYTMDYDRAVLECYDQPCQLELHYQGPSGRRAQALHTPDFLVQHLPLYLDRPTAEAYALLRTKWGSIPFGWSDAAYLTTLYANAPLDWDGKRWTFVVIAPHLKCQSRAVRTVTRWMEQGLDWVLVQKAEKKQGSERAMR